jgi:hypothetical protein
VSGAEHLAQPGSTQFGQLGNEMAGGTGNSDWLVMKNAHCTHAALCAQEKRAGLALASPLFLCFDFQVVDFRFQIIDFLLTMLFVLASIGVLFSSSMRRAVVLASVAVRCNVFTTTSVVAGTGVIGPIIAGAWALITMGVIVGLGCTPSAHFFAWHGAIVVASAIVRVHRTCAVAVRILRTRDRADRRAIVRASA